MSNENKTENSTKQNLSQWDPRFLSVKWWVLSYITQNSSNGDLYLSGNRYLTGQIPSFLGNPCKLKSLDLSQINFCGTIDGFLGNASACLNKSLESLDLSFNNLLGKIPDSLGRLGSLRYLNLEYDSFWGSILASIGSLSSLQDLDLSNNEMNGTIPKSFGQLSKLVNLFLYENFW